jgi:hypothetical protein
LLAVGTPGPDGRSLPEAGFFFFFLPGVVEAGWVEVLGFCGWVEAFCLRGWPLGLGGELEVELVVVDEVEDEPEVELEPEPVELEGELEVVVVEVVVEVVVGVGAHDSDSEVMTPTTGRLRLEIGVPGAMFRLNVYVLPPTTVIVTVQASAEAIGDATTPNSAAMAQASTRTTSSFPLLGNCRVLLYVMIDRVPRPTDSPVQGRRVKHATGRTGALQR